MTESLRHYLEFITETAYLAGKLTLGYFQRDIVADWKADKSPVTIADRLSEEFIRNRIEGAYPNHAIVGEEFGEKEGVGATHRWFIDPIDGTKSFVRGIPLYSVLIGLEIESSIQAGAAYFPAMDEMIAAANGEGCWWNGHPAHVSQINRLEESTVAYTDIENFDRSGRRESFDRLCKAVYYRTGLGDAYGYLLVATGRIEVMLDPVMNPWDCAPFPPILKESGGYFGNWQGKETIYSNEGLATSLVLRDEVIALLNAAQ